MRHALNLEILCLSVLLVVLGIACSEPALVDGDREQSLDGGAVSPTEDGGMASSAHQAMSFDACQDTDLDAAHEITLAALLREMADLTWLTRLPKVPYVTQLQSSHNRSSDSAEPGDADWHADQDFINPAAGVVVTLLVAEGPGVLTRIWSASPSGVLRIFIDGADEPAVEAELADLLSGGVEPFGAPFAFVAAFGHNLYFPIAYSKSCRVTLTGNGEGVVYYHIAHRSYPEGTAIEPFGADALASAECARAVAADYLSSPRALLAQPSDTHETFDLESGAGETLAAVIEAPDGGALLRELRLMPAVTSPDLLRATALVIEMDGEITVRAPVLDFFAMGFDATEVTSVPVRADEHGVLNSRWPMPFERQARIWLEDAGDGELEAQLDVITAPDALSADSLYFYAGWAAPSLELSAPPHDKTLAQAEGAGFYVGNTLNIVNPNQSWWGEGDERVYVDGEAFPSHFGTGTEDYYGYAWCANELFSTPYIGQTASTSHQSFGHASLYRFQILDAISFTTSLRFDLEVRHWGKAVEVSYDSMSVWYARPGAMISGARTTDDTFRLPAIELAPPAGIAAGPYICR